MTEAICLIAVQKNYRMLEQIPEKLRTEALCIAAVEHDAVNAFRYVPKKLMTEAVCLAAVQQNYRVLEEIPEKLRTETLCIAAAKQDISVLHTCQYFSEKVRAKAAAALNAE
jgi:NADH:ubiquinone oxidoreductase subunit F (NADH-binding)